MRLRLKTANVPSCYCTRVVHKSGNNQVSSSAPVPVSLQCPQQTDLYRYRHAPHSYQAIRSLFSIDHERIIKLSARSDRITRLPQCALKLSSFGLIKVRVACVGNKKKVCYLAEGPTWVTCCSSLPTTTHTQTHTRSRFLVTVKYTDVSSILLGHFEYCLLY
jgi:hypothetical protein